MKRTALILMLLLAGCAKDEPTLYQGYAEGEYVRLAAPFAGNLERLAVKRGEHAKAGAPLFALEQQNEAAARREAVERLRNAEARLANLTKGRRPSEIEALEAQRTQAAAALLLSAADLRRQEDLLKQKFVAQERVDEAAAAYRRDKARVAQADADLQTARLGARPDEIRAAEADVAAARAQLEQADWKLEQKTVRAPADALVADTYYVQGDWVAAAAPVVSLLPATNLKARFFVPQAAVGGLKIGQAVELSCDGCGKPIAAAVSYIAPQAEFTPPVIYSRESRSKLVFLVEARPAPADAERLHPGQPLDVRLAK